MLNNLAQEAAAASIWAGTVNVSLRDGFVPGALSVLS